MASILLRWGAVSSGDLPDLATAATEAARRQRSPSARAALVTDFQTAQGLLRSHREMAGMGMEFRIVYGRLSV